MSTIAGQFQQCSISVIGRTIQVLCEVCEECSVVDVIAQPVQFPIFFFISFFFLLCLLVSPYVFHFPVCVRFFIFPRLKPCPLASCGAGKASCVGLPDTSPA
jgi:hypothetical protein